MGREFSNNELGSIQDSLNNDPQYQRLMAAYKQAQEDYNAARASGRYGAQMENYHGPNPASAGAAVQNYVQNHPSSAGSAAGGANRDGGDYAYNYDPNKKEFGEVGHTPWYKNVAFWGPMIAGGAMGAGALSAAGAFGGGAGAASSAPGLGVQAGLLGPTAETAADVAAGSAAGTGGAAAAGGAGSAASAGAATLSSADKLKQVLKLAGLGVTGGTMVKNMFGGGSNSGSGSTSDMVSSMGPQFKDLFDLQVAQAKRQDPLHAALTNFAMQLVPKTTATGMSPEQTAAVTAPVTANPIKRTR